MSSRLHTPNDVTEGAIEEAITFEGERINVVIREHPLYPGYGASADGRVWSRRGRGIEAMNDTNTAWKQRKTSRNRENGNQILATCIDRKRKEVMVTRFIYEVFHGEIPDDYVIMNKDGNYDNCAADNLEAVRWGDVFDGTVRRQTRKLRLNVDDLIYLFSFVDSSGNWIDPIVKKELALKFETAEANIDRIKRKGFEFYRKRYKLD